VDIAVIAILVGVVVVIDLKKTLKKTEFYFLYNSLVKEKNI
jgi:hypothetical protein